MIKGLSEKIKKLRELKGISDKEMARQLGVCLKTIRKWERGVCNPRIKNLIKYREIFGVSISYLMGFESSDN